MWELCGWGEVCDGWGGQMGRMEWGGQYGENGMVYVERAEEVAQALGICQECVLCVPFGDVINT